MLISSLAFGANFYWKSSLSELNAITGVTNADTVECAGEDEGIQF